MTQFCNIVMRFLATRHRGTCIAQCVGTTLFLSGGASMCNCCYWVCHWWMLVVFMMYDDIISALHSAADDMSGDFLGVGNLLCQLWLPYMYSIYRWQARLNDVYGDDASV